VRWIAVALLGALAGCSLPVGEFTIASTHKIPDRFREIAITEGRDCTQIVLGIPFGSLVPSLDRAVAAALRNAPDADSLINASIFREDRFFLLFQRTCVRVKGMAASMAPDPNVHHIHPGDPEWRAEDSDPD
jgi:hypothetical protein